MKCLRCGKCCYFEGKKCPHLVLLKGGTTLCRIYKRRLGTVIGYSDDKRKMYVCCSVEDNPLLCKQLEFKKL